MLHQASIWDRGGYPPAMDAAPTPPPPRGVRVASARGALRLVLEPVGVRVGSRGLAGRVLGTAVAALALTTATVVAAIDQLGDTEPNFLNSGGLVLVAFAVGCLWIFVAMTAAYAFDLGRRTTTIGVLEDTLLVERRGPLGTRRLAIPLERLIGVSVTTDFGVLHQRQHDVLCFDVADRERVVLLRERRRIELEWVRDRLVRTLDLDPSARDPRDRG